MSNKYEFVSTEYGTKVVAHEPVVIAYVVMGGSGCNMVSLDKGGSWTEGADEIIGVYGSQEEAQGAIREYISEITGR